MKVYLVFQIIDYEGMWLMEVFSSSEKAWHYKEARDALQESEDVSYVVQEETVQ